MKKKLPSFLILPHFFIRCFSLSNEYQEKFLSKKIKFSLLFLFFCFSLWAQPPHTLTSNGTIVVPAGVTVMDVQAWGGGGAGGGAGGSGLLEGRSGGGGGGGAYARSNINVTASNTLNIVVAGTTTGTTTNGTAGGHSTITGFETTIYAAGGAGGLANNAGGAPAGGAGGSTAASFGTTKAAGEAGGVGGNVLAALLLSSGKGGNGASPGGGAGGASVPSLVLGTAVGNGGTAPGGGGSGSMSSALAAAQPGGAGARGQVIVTYTCPTYTITGISAVNVCSNLGTTSVVTLTSSAASLPTGTYTVTYSRSIPSATGLTATMTVTNAGTGTFTAVGLNTIGTSDITVTNLTSGVCSSAISTSNVTTVTIFAPSAGGTVTGGTTICAGATSAALSLGGQTGTVQKWQYSVNPFSTWTDIMNTTNTYTSGSLSETTQFRAVVQNGVCTVANSVATTVTVNPLPQGNLTANGTFCATGAGLLTFTATAGTGPYTVVYKENGGADRTALGVVSGTPFATFTTPVTATTTYTLVSVTGANTCSRSSGFTGSSTTITVNPLPQGSLTANGPFCATGSGLLTFTAAAGAGPYTIVYKENGGADRTATGVVSGTPFATFTTPVTATTTYTLVSVTGANTCIRSSGFTGGLAAITINPIPTPTFTVQPAASVCVNTDVTYTTQAGESNYLWNVPGVLNTDYIITSGGISTASNSVTLQWLTIGNKTVTVGYSSIGCASNTSASNTTTVTKTERGAVHGGNHICSGDASPLLTLTDYTGTIVRWEYAEAIPYVWQSFANTSNTYQPGVLTTSTSYRAVVKNGTCPEEFAIETRIDVEPKPSTPVFAIITQPTCVNPTGSVHLSGLLASPNWTITQNGTVFQTYTSSGTSYTITNLTPGNYTFTIHDINICPSLPTINLEIKVPVTNIWNGTNWSTGSPPIVTEAVRFSGNYSTTGDLSGCSCVVDPGANVTVNSNHTLTITNSVNNNGGLLTFENNASLMQVNNVVNTGNIIYKRNTAPVRRYDFTYWSSPIVRTPAYTLHDLSPNTLADKYYSFNPTTGWIISYNGNLEMIPGHGYIVRAPQNFDINSPSVYGSFLEGVPNNGTISVPLIAAEKSHLLGNPYPSALYADQFIFDNSANLYGTLYFWTHNSSPSSSVPGDAQYNYTAADYAIYNLTGSTNVGSLVGQGAGTPGNQNAPLGYIAAGQAFFVKAKTTANAVFTNSMRVPGNNSQFFKTAESSKANIEKHRLWLNMTNTQGLFKQLLVGYIEGATNTWDNNYDGVTINGNIYVDFYSINEGRKLTVQGRALPFLESDVVPLGYRSGIEGELTIAIDHADGDLINHPIYLEDKLTNTTHNLQAGSYTFSTSIGTFLDRFVLKYASASLGLDDFENQKNNLFVSVKNKNIKVNSTHDFIKEVSIFDITGKLIYNNRKIENTELQIPNLQSGDQVLIVKVTLENGKTATRKITFH
ncbi:T9SS sorting signal type C domain-containing protein [Flavobacterium sp. Root186]|uniref:T9SS sorting signal type C domain-containing protein n=1 Tax=Flavobacterium sp. Root186 TaxID=1736485 RepID=UPI0006FD39DB|nr:T9SS sorting signal type C domain-containing protein [Flavobacterium sp. Root186]KRB54085.1 hypothetical protein ASD98_20950 [Flavobacterium sp. Root186]